MKKQLRQQVNNKDVQVFHFSLHDKTALATIEWEGDDECIIGNEIYDVIEKNIEGQTLTIRCINDQDESALIKKFQDSGDQHNSKSRSAILVSLVDSYFTCQPLPGSISENALSNSYSIPGIESLVTGSQDILTPPPQFS
jgi:hypothetical protein